MSIWLGDVRRICSAQLSLSSAAEYTSLPTVSSLASEKRSVLFMAMDHSSGSMGGMPAVCMARCLTSTVSVGLPGMRNEGMYLVTGSS